MGHHGPGRHDREEQNTRTVTYVVIRSGSADLVQWCTEWRNVREDSEKIYGEKLENPGANSVAINTNSTHSMARGLRRLDRVQKALM